MMKRFFMVMLFVMMVVLMYSNHSSNSMRAFALSDVEEAVEAFDDINTNESYDEYVID